MTPEPQSYQLTGELYLALWRLVYRRSIGFSVVLMGAGITVVLGVVLLFVPDRSSLLTGAFAGCVIMIAFLVFHYRVLMPRQAARIFGESVNLKEVQTITMDGGGFLVEQHSAHSRHGWADIAKWDETGEIFTIFPNRLLAYVLPKGQVGAEAVDFARAQLVASGLKKQGKLRK